jgi:PhzF family phenazine biosynthesis protein
MDVQRIAAFSDGKNGGNPAGVVLCAELPSPEVMQSVAKQVGYSETAFAAPFGDGWRVRYFAPEMEVPFCGHATIALGAALALSHGDGIFALALNQARITVEGRRNGPELAAALQSPPTRSESASAALVDAALALFSYTRDDLDPRIAPAIADAGARHLVLSLNSREKLKAMTYDLALGRVLMNEAKLTTIAVVHAQTPQLFQARNPFAAGGIYEDPATGAAAAALASYLRDIGWPHAGVIDIIQGEDMGMRSRLRVEIPPTPGASVRVSGMARLIVP